jgi:hypothetical protein
MLLINKPSCSSTPFRYLSIQMAVGRVPGLPNAVSIESSFPINLK